MIDRYLKYIDHCFRDVPIGFLVGMLLFFCVGTVLLLAFLGVKKGLKWSAGLLLLEYLVLLIILSVVVRKVHADGSYNFIPFWSYRAIQGGELHLLTQSVANVVAFVPIGLLFGFSLPRPKWWKVLLIGGAFSVLIETLQFVLRRGFAEFDDVFHNVVGCVVGYGVYVGVACLVKKLRDSQATSGEY